MIAFTRRRKRQCSVCKWSGPRSRLWRWGDGFVCRNEAACQFRYQFLPRPGRAELQRMLSVSEAGNPSLPIPNDDPDCHCELGYEGPAVTGISLVAGKIGGHEVRVALRSDCPHHGNTIALLHGGLDGALSVGFRFPPARRA